MKIFVKATASARSEKIITIDSQHFAVSTKARPINSLANQAIIKLLASFLKFLNQK